MSGRIVGPVSARAQGLLRSATRAVALARMLDVFVTRFLFCLANGQCSPAAAHDRIGGRLVQHVLGAPSHPWSRKRHKTNVSVELEPPTGHVAGLRKQNSSSGRRGRWTSGDCSARDRPASASIQPRQPHAIHAALLQTRHELHDRSVDARAHGGASTGRPAYKPAGVFTSICRTPAMSLRAKVTFLDIASPRNTDGRTDTASG